MKRGLQIFGAASVVAAWLAFVPAASAQSQHSASVSVSVGGVHNNHVQIGERVNVNANLRPYQGGEKLKLLLLRDGKVIERDALNVRQVRGKNVGHARMRTKPLTEPGRYAARVIHYENPTLSKAKDSSGVFRIKIPDVDYGDSGRIAATFNDLLNRYGYGNAPNGDRINAETARSVHAFRKVNGMSRSESITSDVFHLLASGKGEFELKYPGDGHHVEVDVSRQVMVLADDGEPKYTYHVSTGASGTPSDRGYFHAQWKDPGYNSLGMYFSVYYNGGEATHGYASVPDSPASHGCIRNPIPDSVFIYNWIDLGDPFIVYD